VEAIDQPYVTPEDYLALEARSPVRHEYVDGQVFAMTGATLRHNVIAGNVFAALRAHLRHGPCRVFMSDAKLRVAQHNAYYYPDVMVSCDPRLRQLGANDAAVDAPVLIVEVLSEATEAIDRREKMLAYRTLASLQEYMLVSQGTPGVELFRRRGDVGWQAVRFEPGEKVDLASIGLTLEFSTIYEGVEA